MLKAVKNLTIRKKHCNIRVDIIRGRCVYLFVTPTAPYAVK
jgi:hypothetical protein